MGRWDKPKNPTDKKIEKATIKFYLWYKKKLPKSLRRIDNKISNFVRKHGIRLTIRQYWLTITIIQVTAWVFLPYIFEHIGTGYFSIFSGNEYMLDGMIRVPLLVFSIFLYFAVDKDDDDGDEPDEPPTDDGGIPIKVQQIDRKVND